MLILLCSFVKTRLRGSYIAGLNTHLLCDGTNHNDFSDFRVAASTLPKCVSR